MVLMVDLSNQPTIWGEIYGSISQLKIRGASYTTKQTEKGPVSVPTVLTIGCEKRRWRLLVLDVVELPLQGSKDPDPPIPQSDRAFLYDEVMAQRERARIAERRVKELEEKVATLQADFRAGSDEVLTERIAELQHKFDQLDQERLGLYPVIDNLKRVRDSFEANLKKAEAELARLRAPCPMKDKYPDCEARFDAVEACAADGVVCPRQAPPHHTELDAQRIKRYHEDIHKKNAPPPAAPPAPAGSARTCDTCAKVPGKCEGCDTGYEHWVQRRPV